jgi:2-polyprenyl-3-methyl-5-hydroxy-6-metoxy-1,4-benzoquinol methylase
MQESWQKDYPLLNLTEAEIDDNSSLKKMLRLVGDGKQVLDVGCATGYLARLMASHNCQVTGIEISEEAAKVAEQFCEKVIVADLDYTPITDLLIEPLFDVAVFGDVLEHLRDPWRVLHDVQRILKPGGYVVASIPNVAHGAVRLALWQGQFKYETYGLLDNTHLRFFTRRTVEELFEQTGYFVDVIDPTKLPIFSQSDWAPAVRPQDFNAELLQQLEQEEDADTFQFVLRAIPQTPEGRLLSLNEKYTNLKDSQEQLRAELKQTHLALQKSQAEVHEAHLKNQALASQLERLTAEVEQLRKQTQSLQTQGQTLQQELQQELQRTQTQLHEVHVDREVLLFRMQRLKKVKERSQADLKATNERIAAMETSKFWQLRKVWFKLQRAIGLGQHE